MEEESINPIITFIFSIFTPAAISAITAWFSTKIAYLNEVQKRVYDERERTYIILFELIEKLKRNPYLVFNSTDFLIPFGELNAKLKLYASQNVINMVSPLYDKICDISEKYFLGGDIADVNKNLSIIGTGMFKIENIDNNVIQLVKNAEYWNKEKSPMIDKIYVNIFSNMGEVYESFKNGNIDILNLNIINVEDYVGTIGYNKTEYKGREYTFIALNNGNDLLANSNIRKAISLAIDKNSIIASTLGVGYIPTNYILDYGNWLYNEVEKETYNVDKAKSLLEQNGWELKNRVWQKTENRQTKKLTFTLTVNGQDEKEARFAEEVKNQLANFGISITIKKVNEAGYIEVLNNKDYDLVLATMQSSYSPSLTTLFGENNLANYHNEEVKNLLYEAENTQDTNKIKENYGKINEIYDNEMPYISLYRNTKFMLSNIGLVGVLNPNTYNLFSNIEKWYRQ